MIELILTPEQFAALGLPAEGVTAESFSAALDALVAKLPTAEQTAEQTAASGASAEAATALEAELTAARAELQTFRDAAAAQQQAALAAELGEYDLDEAAAGVMGMLPAEHRAMLLGKMPKKAAPAAAAKPAKEEAPPKPVHDPAAAPDAQQKATALDALIKAIKAEGKFPDYTAAREEARRRQPELFS